MLEKIEKLRGQNSAGLDWGTKIRTGELEAVRLSYVPAVQVWAAQLSTLLF
jgi:hypothetical protein